MLAYEHIFSCPRTKIVLVWSIYDFENYIYVENFKKLYKIPINFQDMYYFIYYNN